jgi:formylglycine-generating enzyme required for sulfatase activity
MKKFVLFLLTLTVLIAACGGGDLQPASEPTLEPAPVSQTESSPQPTELVPVTFEPQAGDTRTYTDGTTIVYVSDGEFNMGIQDGVDNPIHKVYTDGFWIYQVEVSNSRYDLCVLAGICTPPDLNINQTFTNSDWGNMPVTGVTHEQSQAYCEWVHGRLPTEAEWEKTARGTEARIYPWGNDDPTCDRANYKDCNHGIGSVITKPEGKSPLEVLNLAGNVFEWVFDWYADDYYQRSPLGNPAGSVTGEQRVIRGGSYLSEATDLPTYERFAELPDQARDDLGFRCVIEKENVDDFAPMCQGTVILNQPKSDIGCKVALNVGKPYCENGIPYVDILIEHTNKKDTDPVFFGEIPPATCIGGGVMDSNNDGIFEESKRCTAPELSTFSVGVKNYGCYIKDPTCADGYELDVDQDVCVYKGEQSEVFECMEGYQFDPSVGCCTASLSLPYPINCNAAVNKFDTLYCYIGNQPGESVQVSMPTCSIKDKPKEEPEEPTCDPATGAGCPTNSDIRLKTDIVLIGKTESGLPLYTFRYIGDTTIYQGVMAQDVLKLMPEAVVVMPNGYMAVYYEMLGLTMERVR